MTETQNIEYKSSWHDDYLKWICGFANANGGVLFIGKGDNGKVVGISDAKRLMEEIPNKVRDLLGITVDVNLLHEGGLEYIEIVISSSTVAISLRSRYYFRSGTTNRELTDASLTDFLLRKMGMTWDDVIDPNITIDKINPSAIEYFRKEAVQSQRMTFLEKESDSIHILENLNLLTEKKFKRAAILLFGKEPNRFYPNAYAKIGRFGKSDTELLSQEIIEGNILQMPDQILEVLEKKYFVNQISYEGLHRKETSPYPYEAIREVLINAVVHRDYMDSFVQISIYDDKIMFWNAGLLHPSMSLEALKKKHTSRPRNPVLANVFFKAGLVEAWGRGTLKIIEECKKHGLPEPEFAILNGGLSVTIFKDRYTEEQLEKLGFSKRQIKAVLYAKRKGVITNKEYQIIADVKKTTATTELKSLVDSNILIQGGTKGAGAKYTFHK